MGIKGVVLGIAYYCIGSYLLSPGSRCKPSGKGITIAGGGVGEITSFFAVFFAKGYLLYGTCAAAMARVVCNAIFSRLPFCIQNHLLCRAINSSVIRNHSLAGIC